MGAGEPWSQLQPGAFRTGEPAQTPSREALRDRRGNRLLEGVDVGNSAWKEDTSRVDLGGADGIGLKLECDARLRSEGSPALAVHGRPNHYDRACRMVRAVLAHRPEQRTGKSSVTMAVTANDEQISMGGLVHQQVTGGIR